MLVTDWTSNYGPDFDTQVFAIGDVHGQADALERLLDHTYSIPRAARREIIFLGDLGDRGPESLRAFKLAWDASARADERHILPGNHELMMLGAFDNLPGILQMWYHNGGRQTLMCVDPGEDLHEKKALAALREALPAGLEDLLRHGPTHLIRERVLFVHAGLHLEMEAEEFLGQDRFDFENDAHWAWIRQPFLGWESGWQAQGIDLVVHGHTPATTRPLATADEAAELLDVAAAHHAICLDAGAMRRPQVVAVEFARDRHRLHVVPANDTLSCRSGET